MVQSRSDESFRRARDLTTRLLEAGLSDDESRELADLLRHDREIQEWYVDHMILHGILELAHLQPLEAQEPGVGASREEGFSEVETPVSKKQTSLPSTTHGSTAFGFLGDLVQQGISLLGKPSIFAIILALGLPGLLLLLLAINLSRQPISPVPVANRPAAVAQITREHACVWNEATGIMPVGADLYSGRKLELRQGLVEIAFADGATVVLEGPCGFMVRGPAEGFLHAGRLVARMDKGKRGFAVGTPMATIVDLGTEFGVAVADDGIAEAHVFRGEIEIEDTGPTQTIPLRQLHAGEAVQIRRASNGITIQTNDIAAMPDRFVRRVPPESNVGLSEPRVVFLHQGDRNPANEGWEYFWEPRTAPKLENIEIGPVDKDGTKAWSIDDRTTRMGITYRVVKAQGMDQQLAAKAKASGWVIRARLKLAAAPQPGNGISFFSYWDGQRAWRLHPTVDPQGNQALVVNTKSSLGTNVTIPVPNSRGRFVDYEVRYHPETEDADIYINGRLAVTKVYAIQRTACSFHFGTVENRKANIQFARVEWGILDDPSPQEEEGEK